MNAKQTSQQANHQSGIEEPGAEHSAAPPGTAMTSAKTEAASENNGTAGENNSGLEDSVERLRRLEALLFASPVPMRVAEMRPFFKSGENLERGLKDLQSLYQNRGVHLVKRGEGWAFRTAGDLAAFLSPLQVITRPLSKAALEVLAIIAYHQPVTRAEIEEIRGVSLSRGILNTLVENGWVAPGARRQLPGRPSTWQTTAAFLDAFSLDSLDALPGTRELLEAGFMPPDLHVLALESGAAGADEEESPDLRPQSEHAPGTDRRTISG